MARRTKKSSPDFLRAALLESGHVADCAVLCRKAVDESEESVAYVMPLQNASPARIKETLREELRKQGLECLVVVVSELPLTPDGVIDRATLERLGVCDRRSFSRWETLVKTRFACESVTVGEIDTLPSSPRVHVSELSVSGPLTAAAASKGTGAYDLRAASLARDTRETAAFRPSLLQGPELPELPGLPADLGDALLRTAAAFPEHGVTYLYDQREERVESYRALLERAQRILGGLCSSGLSPGDKVIFQLSEPYQFVGAFWACQLGGFVPVPIGEAPSYQEENAALAKLQQAWQRLDRPLVITKQSLVALIQRHGLGSGGDPVRAVAIEDLENGESSEPRREKRGSDLALLLLTSGSTGQPKAVMQDHRAILARSLAAQLSGGFTPDDATLNWLPMEHVGGILNCHVLDVFVGCSEVLADSDAFLRRPLTWLDWVDRYRVTFTWAPNFAFGLVVNSEEVTRQRWDLGSLRFLMNGGEAIVPKLARRFLQLMEPYGLAPGAMRPTWGMSETCSASIWSHAFTRGSTSDSDQFAAVGQPIHGFSLRIADQEDRVLPEGHTGRLQVKGAMVTSGYFGDPEQSAAAFTGDGWFKTGDLGIIRDGELTVTGREKGIIIVNGINYHSHEIETVVEGVAGVEISYVAACPVRRRDGSTEDLGIFFSPSSSEAESLPAVIRSIGEAVRRQVGLNPGYVVPLAKAQIPKTEIGKIQRSALSHRFESGHYDQQLKEIDLLLNNERVLTNWFFRKEWQRKESVLSRSSPDHSTILILADLASLPEGLGAGLAREGLSYIAVHPAAAFERESSYNYRIDVENPGDYRRLFSAISQEGTRLAAILVLDLLSHDRLRDNSGKALDTLLSKDSAVVLLLVQALASSPFAGLPLRLQVASMGSHWLTQDDPAPWRAALSGFLRTVPQEYPWINSRQVDLQQGSPTAETVEQVLTELTSVEPDPLVAYRGGHRFIPRFVRLGFSKGDTAGPAARSGGLYLVSGGAGGIGRLITRWLIEQFDARVLWVGRRAEATMADAVKGACGDQDSVMYRAADVGDADSVRQAVEGVEQQLGRQISGIFHLAGVFDETAVGGLTSQGLVTALHSKTIGTLVLADLAATRPGCQLVTFSSVNGFFGGVSAGAYAAANSFVDEMSAYRSAQGENVCSYAWTLWDETGMSAGYSMKQFSRNRGFFVLAPSAGITSLACALARGERRLWIGLDTTRPIISQHCAAECHALTGPVARVSPSPHGRSSGPRFLQVTDEFGSAMQILISDESSPSTAQSPGSGAAEVPPSSTMEQLIAEVWTHVLAVESVGVDANFYDCGGNSISMARVSSELQKRLGRPVSMTAMFQYPTVRGLAGHLSGTPDRSETLSGEDTADRGVDRRTRMLRRRSARANRESS